jgi:hypothetical protein
MTRTLGTAGAVLTGWVLVALGSSGVPGVELVDGGGMRHIPFSVTFLENLLAYSRWGLLAPVVVWIVTRIVMSDVAPTRRFAPVDARIARGRVAGCPRKVRFKRGAYLRLLDRPRAAARVVNTTGAGPSALRVRRAFGVAAACFVEGTGLLLNGGTET